LTLGELIQLLHLLQLTHRQWLPFQQVIQERLHIKNSVYFGVTGTAIINFPRKQLATLLYNC
jgi:hypothetical protein